MLREEDRIYVTNRLLAIMQMDSYEETAPEKGRPLEEILAVLLGEACRRGICRDSVTARDLFDTRLMDALLDRPARIVGDFYERYKISPREATDAYYRFAIDSDYIREYRVKKDIKWVCETKYGPLDITMASP